MTLFFVITFLLASAGSAGAGNGTNFLLSLIGLLLTIGLHDILETLNKKKG